MFITHILSVFLYSEMLNPGACLDRKIYFPEVNVANTFISTGPDSEDVLATTLVTSTTSGIVRICNPIGLNDIGIIKNLKNYTIKVYIQEKIEPLIKNTEPKCTKCWCELPKYQDNMPKTVVP